MSKPNENDPLFEEFIAFKCGAFAGLKYEITPRNTEYDFMLRNETDIKVLGEIKTRNKWFQDWFIDQKKYDWLMKACPLFRCAPWYVIHCEKNRETYQINLHHIECARNGSMYGQPGIFVPIEQWRVIPQIASSYKKMTSLDWK